MSDLNQIAEQLIEARDALVAYWEQPEGQACFLALRIVEDALADYRALDSQASRARDPDGWRRLDALAGDVTRLRAPLAPSL